MSTTVSDSQRDLQPYRNVALLIVTWPSGDRSAASGVLVGRNDVLTAAHALYNPLEGGWAEDVALYFGAEFNYTAGRFTDTGWAVDPTRWSVVSWPKMAYSDGNDATFGQAESEYDLALLGLDTAIGDTIGWLALDPARGGTQTALAIGYPSTSNTMQEEWVTVTSATWFDLYESSASVMAAGSSGGPLLVSRQVIGIKSTASWWADIGGDQVYGTLVQGLSSNDVLLQSASATSVGTPATTTQAGVFTSGGSAWLAGSTSDDRFISSPGTDDVQGGAGTDTVVFDGSVDGYTLSLVRSTRSVTVTDHTAGRDGTDTLHDVERVQFGTQAFDLFNLARTSTPVYGQSRDFLFDAAYYLLDNPQLASTLTLSTAFAHYLATGAAQGLAPNAWFDPAYYANRWPDLKAANLDAATLFLHYNLYGVWEGRSAGSAFDRFDGNRYLFENPDVAAYVDAHVGDFLGSRSNGAIAHYMIYGADEGRVAHALDASVISSVVLVGVTDIA